jgi:hypothetical protein
LLFRLYSRRSGSIFGLTGSTRHGPLQTPRNRWFRTPCAPRTRPGAFRERFGDGLGRETQWQVPSSVSRSGGTPQMRDVRSQAGRGAVLARYGGGDRPRPLD